MIDAEKKIVKNIACRCGNIHTTTVDRIVIENGAVGRIVEILKDILPCGHVAIASYDDIEVASDIRHIMRKAGYKISEIIYPAFTRATKANAGKLLDIEESVRLIICIGSGSICDMVKYASRIKGIPNALIITAPSTDSWLNHNISLDDDNGMVDELGTAPALVVADTSIPCPRALIAAGISSLYARLIGVFDYQYQMHITGNRICKVIIEELKSDIREFFASPFNYEDDRDLRRLMLCLLDVSLKMSYMQSDAPVMAEDALTRLIRMKKNNCPAAPLIAAYSLDRLYHYWLMNKCKAMMIPPDRSYYYDALNRCFNIDNIDLLLNKKDLASELYSRISFVTENMREELLSELNSLIPETSSRVKMIMNVFADKGYHMSEIIDYKDLMSYIALAAEISSPLSLVKYIDKTGLLCHYVNGSNVVKGA